MAGHRLLRYFRFDHLPEHLQRNSMPFAQLAQSIVDQAATRNDLDHAEITVGLRKLLEAKDCVVRAYLPNDEPDWQLLDTRPAA